MTQLRFPCCALVLGLLAVLQTIHISYAAPNSKSVETHKPPSIADYDLNFQQSGIIKNREALMRKPRAIVGYVSSAQWAFEEFLSMMHASWAHLIELEEQQLRDSAQRNGQERGNSTAHNSKLDLLIFIDNRWYPQVATFCTPLQLAPEYIREAGTDSRVTRALQAMSAASDPDISQCHLILYPPPDLHVWFGYPYINNVHYLADPAIAAMLLSNYGYVMKTDLDAFLTPSWLSYYPTSFEFGTQVSTRKVSKDRHSRFQYSLYIFENVCTLNPSLPHHLSTHLKRLAHSHAAHIQVSPQIRPCKSRDTLL